MSNNISRNMQQIEIFSLVVLPENMRNVKLEKALRNLNQEPYLGIMSQCSPFREGTLPRLRISQEKDEMLPLIRYIVFLHTLTGSE